MPDPDTICGYALGDVRKSLCEAIDHRDRRAAGRWTAELVTTPGAVGSLWAAYWLAWAAAHASPVIPILLKQSWVSISRAAEAHAGDWTAFRNDPAVRACAAEATTRLLDQPRLSAVVWPSREIILYDVGTMRSTTVPVATDGPIVMTVWRRDEDALEYRMMAGRFLTSLESGDLRGALSAVAWTLLPFGQQGLPMPLKCSARGPASLPAKVRTSPLWFWLDLGRMFFQRRVDLHRGWVTMQAAITEAFQLNYRRWTAVDRMKVLLAWVHQLRASLQPQPEDMWMAPPVNQSLDSIDLAYKELAAEKGGANAAVFKGNKDNKDNKDKDKKAKKDDTADVRTEAKMAEADAAIMASLGLSADDF